MSLSTLLPKFIESEILSSDSQTKKLSILGKIDGQDAILQLEKTQFSKSPLKTLANIEEAQHNDVYYWGTCNLNGSDSIDPGCKVNLIFPASQAHIDKYRKHSMHMVRETPETYEKIVRPYIDTQKGSRLDWVRNILYHGQEKERVVFKNKDYILLPDMKWDGKALDSLYLVCIVYREDIASIRDLKKDDIPYLESIQESILTEVAEKYHIKRDELRLFVHYQPSFYHFHIHVVKASYSGIGQTILAGKAILLAEVIDMLHYLGKDGFGTKTITYGLSEGHDLWDLGMKEYGI